MIQNTDPDKCLILRLKVFESSLSRNVAKFGSMNPYLEVSWNDEKWRTKALSGAHLTPIWNEGHIFEALDPAPAHLKVVHNGLLFTNQEIGSLVISVEDLTQGKTKEWLEIYYEGNSAGKILISANMYEERRSEQSTHNTSYASVDLKKEYARKLNELELEKEELEFYRRKYKRKVEKFNQEKRNYKAKVTEIVRRTTPKHTEESSSEEIGDYSQPQIVVVTPNDETEQEECLANKEKALLQQEKQAYSQLKNQLDIELARLRREKHRMSVQRKLVAYSQGKLSDIAKSMDIGHNLPIKKSISEEKIKRNLSKFTYDWQEYDDMKIDNIKEKEENNEELLELRLNMGDKIASPKRATTPKSTDMGRANVKFRNQNYSTGKFFIYDS
ncbi:hypothetical protein SteCoe_16164 [Stentor coeruleus]|uniref:C2 domain-containing protein n=1 Tax=Stentor coeruleus TaxID=5963 RepID=A0A1R2C233_9CILI|nr:hypothetical protein SteCoe_16164 [Stentor coeruleus]